MRRIVVIGKTGQLARAIIKRAVNFDCDVKAYGREDCDLSVDDKEVKAFAKKIPKCDGIIIAAAYTAVDAAENDEVAAFRVNAKAPEIFAELCRQRSIPLIYVSTDYVFSGVNQTPIAPDMPTEPVNVYGRSKLMGELAIINSGARAIILRTSWVFDGLSHNFLTTMLQLGKTRKNVDVVEDQIGRPTYAGYLADACLTACVTLINNIQIKNKIYHISGAGEPISWADFAIEIFRATQDKRVHRVNVNLISSLQYPRVAKRPHYSVLDISEFEHDFQVKAPHWQEGLMAALQEWNAVVS